MKALIADTDTKQVSKRPTLQERTGFKTDLNIVMEESGEHALTSLPKKRQLGEENKRPNEEEKKDGMVINNLDDYRAIVQKVIDAKRETKRLSQKFEML